MLADDLLKEGRDVVEAGVNFSSLFDVDKVFHCHIINDNSLVESMIHKVIDFLKLERNDEQVVVQQQKLAERVTKDLEMRWEALCEREDIEYRAIVKMGEVARAMDDVVLDSDPGLIVFGRHKTIHFEEAIIGNMTFSKMMSFDRAICVIP